MTNSISYRFIDLVWIDRMYNEWNEWGEREREKKRVEYFTTEISIYIFNLIICHKGQTFLLQILLNSINYLLLYLFSSSEY
jgi:hypothetical protein